VSADDRFSKDAQRYLDGEPHGELQEGERHDADRLIEAVSAYVERTQPLDAALDDSVMAAVRARPTARRHAGWRWLFEPRQVSLRPVWIPAMAAAALMIAWLGVRGPDAGEPTGAAVAVADTVFVRFELAAPNARAVSVAGSFNGWQPDVVQLVRGETGVWSTTLALPLGEHAYQFVVDGERWISDPTAHAQVDDGFGGTNSVIVVGPRGVVRS